MAVDLDRETEEFIIGLEQCRKFGAMRWHGKMPDQIIKLFNLDPSNSVFNYQVLGIYIQRVPRYEAFTPDWIKDAKA
jgi:hypothetical protein